MLLGETAKNTLVVFSGNLLLAASGVLTLSIVSRQIGPAGLGIFSIAFSVFLNSARFTDLGLHFAFTRYAAKYNSAADSSRVSQYFKSCLKMKMVLLIPTMLIGFLTAPRLAQSVFHAPEAAPLMRIAFLGLFSLMFFDYFTVTLQALQKFIQSILMGCIPAIVKLLSLGILFVTCGFSAIQAFTIYVFTPILGVPYAIKKLRENILWKEKLSDPDISKSLIQFGKWAGAGILFSSISGNLDVYVIANRLTTHDVGIYSAAYRLASIFLVLAGSIGTVLVPRASSFSSIDQLKSFLKKSILLILGLIVLLLAILPVSKWVILLTVGSQFRESIPMFQILCAAMVLTAITSPLNSSFFALDHPQYLAVSSLIHMCLFLFLNLHFIPKWGAWGAGLALLITNVIILVFTVIYLAALLKYKQPTSNPSNE